MTTKKRAAAAAALCAALSPAMAAPPFLDVLVYEYGQCVQPGYHQAGLLFYDGPGSYQLAVKDAAYAIALQERMGFSLQAGIDGPVVAVVKLERPPAAQFQEQALWRERGLRDVAERSGVALEERAVEGGARLSIVNKSEITGNYVGQSLLIDPQRQLFVDMAWPNKLPGYKGPGGMALVRKVQDDLWRRMQSCQPPPDASTAAPIPLHRARA
ncbi:hypothetical protein ACQ4WP_06100 [Janthinobacterium sp. GB4P2]|uniref:hypothetical protein n=1 Tax=Janthinobacterium sp. GB4P2 TaxID=3424189 RepID=UPI003F26E42F